MKAKFLLSGTIALCMFAFGSYANAMFGVGGGNNDIPKPDIPLFELEHVLKVDFKTVNQANKYSKRVTREGLICTVSSNPPSQDGNPLPPFYCNVYVEQWPSK